jgi:5-methylcytosine-specific restriction endonuclease McrA
MAQCSVGWCELNTRSSGSEWCEKHYMQIRRNGVISPRPLVYTSCAQCGKKNNGKFCSERCAVRFSRGRIEQDRECIVCDGVIKSSDRLDKIYCSRRCSIKASGSSMNRYARNKNAEGEHSNTEWQEILSLYGRRCLVCGTVDNISKDHIVPLVAGGTNWPWNLQPLCMKHNREKWMGDTDYREDTEIEEQIGLINYMMWLEDNKGT